MKEAKAGIKIYKLLEDERCIIESNRELIRIFEAKIEKVIARVWEG